MPTVQSAYLERPHTLRLQSPLLAAGGVGVLYLLLARVSLALVSDAEAVAVFWPASGLAAGAMVALQRRARKHIPLAVLVATLLANLGARDQPLTAIAFGLCNALECALFCFLLEKMESSGRRLESLGSVAVFLLAAAISAAVAALAATAIITQAGLSGTVPFQVWLRWFEADALGIIALAPALITLPTLMHDRPSMLAVLEGIAGVVITPVVTFVAFKLVYSNVLSEMSPRFALLPLLLWMAARTPAMFAGLSAFLMSLVMVIAALDASWAAGEASALMSERLAAAKLAILSGCLVLLTLSAMFARLNNQAAALRSSERRLRHALEAGRMYAFEYDSESGIVNRVGGLVERLGLPAAGSFDEFFAILHNEDKDSFVSSHNSLSPDRPHRGCLVRLYGRNGEILSIENHAEAEFDKDGKLLRFHGTCVDVTELKAQAEELREALKAGRVYAFEYDVVNGTARRSENAAEILGVPAELARSSHSLIFDIVHPEDVQLLQRFDRAARSRKSNTVTFRFIRPDGRVGWLEASFHSATDGKGNITSIRGLARDVTANIRAEQKQEHLIRELDHRVKNALARMAVVVELSKEGHQTLDEYVAVIRGRIGSMARTQERLSGSRWSGVGITTLIEDELAAYRTEYNCMIDGPDLMLEPDTAQAFAFTLHELATNAAKYGALSSVSGRVEVRWAVRSGSDGKGALSLVWREQASGPINVPTRESYGLRTIRNLLRYECDARVDLAFETTGLICTIELPLSQPLLEKDASRDGISPTPELADGQAQQSDPRTIPAS